jgi:hypothetical protein
MNFRRFTAQYLGASDKRIAHLLLQEALLRCGFRVCLSRLGGQQGHAIALARVRVVVPAIPDLARADHADIVPRN